MANSIIPIKYLLLKMMITIGLGLQAFGIILEGIGLIMVFRSFGSAEERWEREIKVSEGTPSGDYYEEGKKFSIQIIIICLGLALQFVGLFIT
jgi:hypothetical protein